MSETTDQVREEKPRTIQQSVYTQKYLDQAKRFRVKGQHNDRLEELIAEREQQFAEAHDALTALFDEGYVVASTTPVEYDECLIVLLHKPLANGGYVGCTGYAILSDPNESRIPWEMAERLRSFQGGATHIVTIHMSIPDAASGKTEALLEELGKRLREQKGAGEE